ncbi:PAS domain S-box protein [bacterium]|nr:PAS domain S-box protein [bacterium]
MQYSTVTYLSLLNFFFLVIAFLAVYQYAYRLKMQLRISDDLRRQSEAYRDLFNGTWDSVFYIDNTGHFVFINRAGALLLGYEKPADLVGSGMTINHFMTDFQDAQLYIEELKRLGHLNAKEIELRTLGGERKIIELTVNLRYDGNKEVIGYEGICRDVTERIAINLELKKHHTELEELVVKRTSALHQLNLRLAEKIEALKCSDACLKKSLKEKDFLLKEVHHRVKNNLQLIVSLLNLQGLQIQNDDMLDIFNESEQRIRTIALVHEKLYASNDFSAILFRSFVNSLAIRLYSIYNQSFENIIFTLEDNDISIGLDLAIPCALVMNELINNILKHAFKKDIKREKRIFISLIIDDNNYYEINIIDTGCGLPDHYDPHNSDSLGMKMMHILVEEQLKGSIRFSYNCGTRCCIRFPRMK